MYLLEKGYVIICDFSVTASISPFLAPYNFRVQSTVQFHLVVPPMSVPVLV